MNLGEKIYKLRTEKNLSQGDLADTLHVSRQSISKWENNSAVPELEKLVKLSEIFDVTMDELVRDKQPEQTQPNPAYVQPQEKSTNGKTVGTILLCFGAVIWLMVTFFGGILAGLILASPFIGCGLICLLARSHVGLWCTWCIYSFIDLYLRFATGVNWHFVFVPAVYTGGWAIQLIVAWAILIAYAILTVITVLRFREPSPRRLQRDAIAAAVLWFLYIFVWVVFIRPPITEPENIALYRSVSSVTGWLRSGLLAAALTFSVRIASALRKKKQ